MIQINNKEYELKYNIGRIELIENVTKKPTLAALSESGGMLGVSSLKAYFAYGLKEAGSDIFVPIKEGMKLAEELIQAEGYSKVCGLVINILERDWPFFFRAD